jgi:hypothetical protein
MENKKSAGYKVFPIFFRGATISAFPEMVLSEDALFSVLEKWAVGASEGFVDGRLPLEDEISRLDFISKLTWKTPDGIPPPSMPKLMEVQSSSHPIPKEYAASVGPFHRAWSVPVPEVLGKLLGIPSKGSIQTAKVDSLQSTTPMTISKIPTCTDKKVFALLKPDQHPPHPIIQFSHPVSRVHVHLYNPSTQKSYWDATYDLHGKFQLGSRSVPVASESPIPDYIPPCTIQKSYLQLDVDAERPGPMRVEYLNRPSWEMSGLSRAPGQASAPAAPTYPLHELQSADGIICNTVKELPRPPDPSRSSEPATPSTRVSMPGAFGAEIFNFESGRSEASELHPSGVPMMDIAPKLDEGVFEKGSIPVSLPVDNGQKNAVFLHKRHSDLSEIKLDQLFPSNSSKNPMGMFDTRKPVTNPTLVDPSAIMKPGAGFHQPTVTRTVYSQMWQGKHDHVTPLHPSISFKHPANFAHVVMRDKTEGGKIVWDAVFNVGGAHKIAVDQKPIDGTITEFPGIIAEPHRTHVYSMTVDADNPQYVPPTNNGPDRVMEFWRQSEFLFGTSRPGTHAEATVVVQPGGVLDKLGSLFRS